MDKQKVFVSHDNTAVIKCIECGTIKNVPVGKFKERNHTLKIKCACGSVFGVSLDFRKVYRKDVELGGTFAKHPPGTQWNNMIVRNISMAGIGVTIQSSHTIAQGDRLQIKFILDDDARSEIEKKVTVVQVNDNKLGCEFSDSDRHDKVLGFYLMP